MQMSKLSEPLLKEYAEAGAITAAKVIWSEEQSGWLLVINLNWKEGDLTVYSQRNQPRAWASIDRLIGHLRRITPSITELQIFLNGSVPP